MRGHVKTLGGKFCRAKSQRGRPRPAGKRVRRRAGGAAGILEKNDTLNALYGEGYPRRKGSSLSAAHLGVPSIADACGERAGLGPEEGEPGPRVAFRAAET
jgi:hypothetical protein